MFKYLLILCFSLSACSSAFRQSQTENDYFEVIRNKASHIYKIYPTGLSLVQLVSYKKNKETKRVQVYMMKNHQNDLLKITALSLIGVELVSFRINEKDLKTSYLTREQLVFFEKFIFTDILLTYANKDYIEKISHHQFQITDRDEKRLVHFNNLKIAEISYSSSDRWNSDVFIKNFTYDYGLELKKIGDDIE